MGCGMRLWKEVAEGDCVVVERDCRRSLWKGVAEEEGCGRRRLWKEVALWKEVLKEFVEGGCGRRWKEVVEDASKATHIQGRCLEGHSYSGNSCSKNSLNMSGLRGIFHNLFPPCTVALPGHHHIRTFSPALELNRTSS